MDDDVDWTMISFEPKPKPGGEKSSPVSAKTCPKCGKTLSKGGHFHVKHCRGEK